MKTITVVILAAFAAATVSLSSAQAQQCPAGSFPAFDAYGNKICKRFSDNGTASAEIPRGQTCPSGAFPTFDNYGNKICRSFETPNQPRTDYYDTSRGCPAGMFQAFDNYGNKVCKPF